MMRRIAAALGALGMAMPLALAAPAQAHHSFAMFDTSKEVTIEGTVTDFQWTNPHSWIQVLVKDARGQEVEWSIEGASPNNLQRFGWKRTSLKPGDHVQCVLHPNKAGGIGGSLVRVTVNGQVVGAARPS